MTSLHIDAREDGRVAGFDATQLSSGTLISSAQLPSWTVGFVSGKKPKTSTIK